VALSHDNERGPSQLACRCSALLKYHPMNATYLENPLSWILARSKDFDHFCTWWASLRAAKSKSAQPFLISSVIFSFYNYSKGSQIHSHTLHLPFPTLRRVRHATAFKMRLFSKSLFSLSKTTSNSQSPPPYDSPLQLQPE